MKQLTQEVFKDAPKSIRSAYVREDSSAWLTSMPAHFVNDMLAEMGGTFGMSSLYVGDGYDTTNWQASAINREV